MYFLFRFVNEIRLFIVMLIWVSLRGNDSSRNYFKRIDVNIRSRGRVVKECWYWNWRIII